jgi:hypothetical protein
MKTSKYFSASLLAAGLVVGIGPAYADDPPSTPEPEKVKITPNYAPDEQGLLCLAESAVSAVAAIVTQFGCRNASYGLSAAVGELGDGSLKVGTKRFVSSPVSGGRCFVSTPGNGSIGGKTVTGYRGFLPHDNATQAWSSKSAILISGAVFTVAGIRVPFDEHNIKNFWRYDGYDDGYDSFDSWDDGLEVITKGGRPLSKWWQDSYHRPPDGQPGKLEVSKNRIWPGTPCTIQLTAEGDHDETGYTQWSGDITVGVPE